MAARRIANEPAFVLHRYDWSESSLILEVFTRNYGRIALVAKGAKRPSSNFRPVLLPLQLLHLTWTVTPGSDSEIHPLKGAEWMGGYTMPTGDALLSGYYVNELLMRLLARDDPHARLFDAYAALVPILAFEHGEALQPVLRTFELLLLREIGLLPSLDAQTATLRPLGDATRYVLVPEGGLREASPDDRASLDGAAWRRIADALDSDGPFTATLHACADAASDLKLQLRTLLQYHCGNPPLRTRQLLRDIQAL